MQFSVRSQLLKPLPIFGRLPFDSYARMMKYVSSTRHLRFRGNDYHNAERINVSVCKTKLPPASSQQLKDIRVEYDLLFDTELRFPGSKAITATYPDGSEYTMTLSEKRALWSRELTPSRLQLCANTYLLALEFAFPSVSFGDQQSRVGRTVLRGGKALFSMLPESLNFLREQNVHPLTDLTPDQTWKWISAQNGVFSGYSDTPASRAFGYFTRLYNTAFRNDELSDLVWALASIEALLVDAGRSSVGQLKSKLACLFDEHEGRKFILDQVERTYGFRSKMIHGNRQVLSVLRRDEDEPDGRFSEEYDSARYAVGMAFILIQRLIRENRNSFSFHMVLDK